MNRNGLSRPLPYLIALTLACLNPINSQAAEVLSSTSSSIILVDERMLPALFGPMSHLVPTHSVESVTTLDNSLAAPRAALVRAVIAEQRPASEYQLNIKAHEPASKIDFPRARDFTPVSPLTMTDQVLTSSLSFTMMGR